MEFVVYIPNNPIGLNQTYKVGRIGRKSNLYKAEEATDWATKAALIIGSEAAIQEWEDTSKYYSVYIRFSSKHDVDAPIKLVIDTLATKLGFNDNRIKKQCSEKISYKEKEGVWITLEPYNI